MIQTISKVISYLFHPFIMPVLGIFLLFYLPTMPVSYNRLDALYFFPNEAKQIFLIVLGVLTFVAPAISLMIMRMNGMVSSLKLENREERVYPYSLVTFYFLLSYIYVRYQIPEELMHPALLGYLFGILISLIVAFIINSVGIKISLHALGTFGICGGLLAYNQSQLPFFQFEQFTNLPLLILLFVASGIVCASRLYLKAHTLGEVLLGMLTGFGVLFLTVKYGLYL